MDVISQIQDVISQIQQSHRIFFQLAPVNDFTLLDNFVNAEQFLEVLKEIVLVSFVSLQILEKSMESLAQLHQNRRPKRE